MRYAGCTFAQRRQGRGARGLDQKIEFIPKKLHRSNQRGILDQCNAIDQLHRDLKRKGTHFARRQRIGNGIDDRQFHHAAGRDACRH